MKKMILFISVLIIGFSLWNYQLLIRLYDGIIGYQASVKRLELYRLSKDRSIEEITEKLIQDKSIPLILKEPLIKRERRIYIFKYPSGEEQVAGYASIISHGQHPTLLFLRGGNGAYGIARPNNTYSFLDNYNVIGTLYRGNIYGGHDQFGGKDVEDVENLIKFISQLEDFTQTDLKAPYAMMGVSRGAMQMFVSLSRSELVNSSVNKAISLSGNVDLQTTVRLRPEMRALLRKKFNEQESEKDFQLWLNDRNPVGLVDKLNPSLKVLMIYGLKDNRVPAEEQINLYNALTAKGFNPLFFKIPEAGHEMDGYQDKVKEIVTQFLVK